MKRIHKIDQKDFATTLIGSIVAEIFNPKHISKLLKSAFSIDAEIFNLKLTSKLLKSAFSPVSLYQL